MSDEDFQDPSTVRFQFFVITSAATKESIYILLKTWIQNSYKFTIIYQYYVWDLGNGCAIFPAGGSPLYLFFK
mgnify:CR=1 FL=1